MKKLLTVLLTLLMVFTLVGCNDSKQEEPTIENEPEVNEPIVGGYVDAEDKNLTPELIEMFEKAFEGFAGASYTPVMLEATQVVAGTNYKFLADGSKTTNPMIQGTYYVYINKDLQGNISLLDIEVIDEHEVKEFEPEVKPDTEIKQKEDYTGVKFWVVVYDQYDNEISRTTAVYGSTVKDPSGKDVVVDHNKYFHTVVDYPAVNTDEPNNPPLSDCTINIGKYHSLIRTISKVDNFNFYVEQYYCDNDNGILSKIFTNKKMNFQFPSITPEVGKWYHYYEEGMGPGSEKFELCENPNSHINDNVKLVDFTLTKTDVTITTGGDSDSVFITFDPIGVTNKALNITASNEYIQTVYYPTSGFISISSTVDSVPTTGTVTITSEGTTAAGSTITKTINVNIISK